MDSWLVFECPLFKIQYLESNKKGYGFHRVVSSVDVVSHEQVVCVGRLSPNTEELHQVVELAMHVPTYCHWTLDFLNVGLFSKNLLRL